MPAPKISYDSPRVGNAADAALPLGARLWPRGVFEDDWAARPTLARPWPVVLIHGTTDTKGVWQHLGAELRADGWAVFAPDYGQRATWPLAQSAPQLGAYIQAVLTVTGAEQVVLVGHSQGGLLARYWMRTADTAGLVKHLVCLSSPNHGTTKGGIVSPLVATRRQEHMMDSLIASYFGPAGLDQVVGAETFELLADDLEDGVGYTCVATKQDTIVVPPETCFLEGARNLYVQDVDRRALVTHVDMPMDRRVRAIVREELTGLADPGAHPTPGLPECATAPSPSDPPAPGRR